MTWTQTLLRMHHDVTLPEASAQQLHDCLAQVIMMGIHDDWSRAKKDRGQKRHAYYFSAEFLIGRLVYSNLYNLGLLGELKTLFAEKGADLACLEEIEDAALGNGGLGRLAACYLDSAATCNIPLTGYGLRYRFGLFKQRFENFAQKELADDWTKFGDPWSIRRYTHSVKIKFPDHTVIAVPYDTPVIGYRNGNVGTLRLWQCEAEEELDFDAFNAQDYERALAAKNKAEDITRVLYPNDSTREGKRLRLKQQYVISSASLQDILRTFRENHGSDLSRLPELCAIQLNDTHPTVSIPELIRLLMADGMDFERAFDITRQVFSYTNHTVMSEALEKWDMELMRSVVPEICDIIVKIDARLKSEHPELYIIKDKTVHMANLSVYAGTKVNGVARIHSDIIKYDVFRDWSAVYPERFTNVTNGITPRRWLGLCNPELAGMLRDYVGDGFLTHLDTLEQLKDKIGPSMIDRFNQIKYIKKQQLAEIIKKNEGVEISPDFVFDVQVKRMHEYKRQLLNALAVMDIYLGLKDGSLTDFTPTAFIFGAKAAPGYYRAKSVIRYINRIARLINNDEQVKDKIKVVFVQNYNCSYAEHIIPAADISEQISPAGTEASGTGNMKLMLNGAVTLGTLDGANVEIVEKAGMENNYIFGAKVEDITRIRDSYRSRDFYEREGRLHRVIDTLVDGTVETDDGVRELYHALLDGANWHRPDHYFVLLDYRSYYDSKLRAINDWRDREAFGRKCLMNIASAGKFSSDRAIRQYAEEIWHV
ncbi:MAG: glycogen/starch/alpha-glucan phosphorylase [Butyricicoccus sp.]|nr:glycogen/starch/alpha-glucan phosphorylase [Butyricicoccus sp.]